MANFFKDLRNNENLMNDFHYETKEKFLQKYNFSEQEYKETAALDDKKYSDTEIIASINTVWEILDLEEFELAVSEYKEDDDTISLGFNLIDRQGGNLGNIESEHFSSLASVIDRMDSYHEDYLYRPFEERKEANEPIPQNDWDRKILMFLESDYCTDLLYSITPSVYENYIHRLNENRENKGNEFDDLKYLIDKDIALKILNTESAVQMLEYDGRIFLSHYDTTESKEELLEEILEYENQGQDADYTDANFSILASYREVIESEFGMVLDDMNDIGIYSENDEYNFYLSEYDFEYLGAEDTLQKCKDNILNKCEENAKFEYMLLDRLRTDCDYYLGNGNRNEKNLWAGNVEEQIEKMKELYNSLPVKPDWLSMNDILNYESLMQNTMSMEEMQDLLNDTMTLNEIDI